MFVPRTTEAPLIGRFLLLLALTAGAASAHSPSTENTAQAMSAAAGKWLASLDAAQRKSALLDFSSEERTRFRYVPGRRAGLTLGEMSSAQREQAHALLKSALSEVGHRKVVNIIELELVLREIELTGFFRDPDKYYLVLFGAPDPVKPWGWRFEGHHLSLNFTLAGNRVAVDLPSFFGANPAEVKSGTRKGLRVLKEEGDAGWALLDSLDAEQRRAAVVSDKTYGDIVTGTGADLAPLAQAGLAAKNMNDSQRALLKKLIEAYTANFHPELAAQRQARVDEDGIDAIRFAWAGAVARGKPHYYRVQGPRFLIEYDASQDGGNHNHTVWRDFNGDFGRDLLRDHYQSGHSHK